MNEVDLAVRHPQLRVDKKALRRMIHRAVQESGPGFPEGELSVSLMTDQAIADLHRDYLDDPSTTDVITFPGDQEMDFAGEICVSADRAMSCHTRHGTTFSEELSLYIVHGILHLAGLDDHTESEIRMMRQEESRVMNLLKQDGLITEFTHGSFRH